MSRTGAQLLVAGLEAAGVDVVFGLPGVHNLAAWEALRESPIRLVGVRHEQAAVYAADGYARVTGRLGVALVTTGPGAANTLAAGGEGWASRSPVLVVATDIPTGLRMRGVHRGVLHECVDQPAMFAPVTKQQFTPATFAELALAAFAAPDAAVQAPARPVYLEIPTDLLSASGAEPAMASARPVPSAPDVEPALDVIAGARRPLVWAGGGAVAAEASAAVAALGRCLGAPIVTTYQANGIAAGEPLRVGLPPHAPEVGAVWDEADLVVAVGSDLDGTMTQNWRMPAPPRLVAINVDEADAAKNYAPDAIVAGDARAACEALTLEVSGAREPWVDVAAIRDRTAASLREQFPAELAFLDAFAAGGPGRDGGALRHVHTRLLARRLLRGGGAAPAHQPARVGDPRLRVPPVARRRARGRRAGRLGVRRRRVPLRLRRACDRRAGAAAPDDRDRRRRRLRDAALRPAPVGRGDVRRRPADSRLRLARRELRRAGRRRRRPRRRLLGDARAPCRGSRAERPRRARGARAAADDVAALVSAAALIAASAREHGCEAAHPPVAPHDRKSPLSDHSAVESRTSSIRSAIFP